MFPLHEFFLHLLPPRLKVAVKNCRAAVDPDQGHTEILGPLPRRPNVLASKKLADFFPANT